MKRFKLNRSHYRFFHRGQPVADARKQGPDDPDAGFWLWKLRGHDWDVARKTETLAAAIWEVEAYFGVDRSRDAFRNSR